MNFSASKAPLKLTQKTKDGNTELEFSVKPLSDQALENLTLWIRAAFISANRLSLRESVFTESLTLEERDQAMKEAFAFSLSLEWDDDTGKKMLMETRSGKAKMLYESLFPTTPGITFVQCYGLMKCPENGEAFWDVFETVNDLVESEDGDDNPDGEPNLKKTKDGVTSE